MIKEGTMIECIVNGERVKNDLETVVKIKEEASDNLLISFVEEEISESLYFYWDDMFEGDDVEWVKHPESFLSLCGFVDPEFDIVGLRGFSEEEGVRVLGAKEVIQNGDVVRTSYEDFVKEFRKKSIGEYNE